MVRIIQKLKNLKERKEIKRAQEKLPNRPKYGVTYGEFYGHPLAEEHGSGYISARMGGLQEKEAKLSLSEEDYARGLTSLSWAESNYEEAAKIFKEDKELREKHGNKDPNRLSRLAKLAKQYTEKASDIHKKGVLLYEEHKEALKKMNPDDRQTIDVMYGKFEDYVNKYIKDPKEREQYLKHSKLEKKVITPSIIALMGGLFFLSSNVTGNVIGNMTNSTSNWIGGVLFALGLVGALFYFKKK